MSQPYSLPEDHPHRFPIIRFTVVVSIQLVLAFVVFRFLGGKIFEDESRHPLLVLLGTALFGIPLSLFEYFYHRYLLHSSILPFLSRMHRAHREHHDLTYVKAPVRANDTSQLVPVKSEYPVEHLHQEESMMFPDTALSGFYLLFLVTLGWPVKAMFPEFPAITAVILAVTLYYCAYEVWHAVLHLPFERYWQRFIEGKYLGPISRRVYGFHLMHHWRPTANVAVVGLWGIALWDHLFRTHRRPGRLPLDGSQVSYEDAALSKPLWPISAIDRWQPAMYKWSRRVEQKTISLFSKK